MTPHRTPWLLLTLATLACGSAWAGECDYHAERRLELPAAALSSLRIQARAGSLDMVGDPQRSTVVAVGMACASSEKLLAEMQLDSRGDGAAKVIEVVMPDLGSDWGRHSATMDLTVQVPARLALRVEDSSGDLTVARAASADIEDSSGDIEVRDVSGEVRIRDSSGDIDVEDSGSVVVLADSSGDIALNDIRGDAEVRIDSSGGIEFAHIGGNVRVGRDSSGSIRADHVAGDFTVGPNGSGGVDYSDVGGRVEVSGLQ
jgi:hypothetical protein